MNIKTLLDRAGNYPDSFLVELSDPFVCVNVIDPATGQVVQDLFFDSARVSGFLDPNK